MDLWKTSVTTYCCFLKKFYKAELVIPKRRALISYNVTVTIHKNRTNVSNTPVKEIISLKFVKCLSS